MAFYSMNEPWNKTDTKGEILYDPIYMKYQESKNLQKTCQSMVIGVKVGEIKSYCLMAIRYLFRTMNVLELIVVMIVQHHECTTAELYT